MKKEIKRGYVKWTDEDGVFHKEPLADHPDLLAKASPKEQFAAEEVVRLNEAAEAQMAAAAEAAAIVVEESETLELGDEELWSEDHEEALEQLREVTSK